MARSHSDYLQSITSTKRAPTPSAILNSMASAVNLMESAYAADYAPLDRGEGSSSTSIVAADPCERCVRAGRTCRGPSGSRCEHCKRLKQKCSNSSISLRGKHAAKAAAQTASTHDATRPTEAPINGPVTAHPSSLKRKDRDDTPSESANYSTIDEDENCGVVPARQDKKRRIQKEVERRNAIVAGKVIKHVDELGECIKRLQDTYTREMACVRSIMAALEEDMAQYLPEDHHTMPDSAASH